MTRTHLDTLIARAIGWSSRPLTRAAIEAWQGERLRQVVAYCRKRSPYYRRSFAAAGVGAIRGLEDLASLPFTSEATLRAHGLELLCVSQDAVARIMTMRSSGTTGDPKRICLSEQDLDQTLDFFHLGMRHLVDPGQTVAIMLPGETPDSTGHLLARALGRMQVGSRTVGLVSKPARMARILAEFRPDVLVGFPVQILAVARMAAHLRLPLGPIRSVLLCSDHIPRSLRQILHDLLSCEVFSHYGTVETGLGGGVDCEAHAGCHLREADLFFEIIHPRTGASLPEGEWGEIVCTTLTRTGMPLIRYRTGDLGRLLPGPCACGSVVRRLDTVLGRISQTRTLACGRQLALHTLDDLLLPIPGLLDFKASLEQSEGRECLRLHLTTLPGSGEATRAAVAEALAREFTGKELAVRIDLAPDTVIHHAKRVLQDHREEIQP